MIQNFFVIKIFMLILLMAYLYKFHVKAKLQKLGEMARKPNAQVALQPVKSDAGSPIRKMKTRRHNG